MRPSYVQKVINKGSTIFATVIDLCINIMHRTAEGMNFLAVIMLIIDRIFNTEELQILKKALNGYCCISTNKHNWCLRQVLNKT